jgi:hypothetical protein
MNRKANELSRRRKRLALAALFTSQMELQIKAKEQTPTIDDDVLERTPGQAAMV